MPKSKKGLDILSEIDGIKNLEETKAILVKNRIREKIWNRLKQNTAPSIPLDNLLKPLKIYSLTLKSSKFANL